MRTSRSDSEVQKVVYPKCNVKKQHSKQTLNLVCLTKTCKFAGPICVLCKTKDHVGHNVIPIKTFCNQLKEAHSKLSLKHSTIVEKIEEPNIDQKMESINEPEKQKSNLQILKQTYDECLGMLKIQVTQIALEIQKVQQKIHSDYQQAKKSLFQEANKSEVIQQSLEYFKQRQLIDALQLRKNIDKISKLIKINKNQIKIESNEKQILSKYSKSLQCMKDNLFYLGNELSNMFSNINDKQMAEKMDIGRPRTAMSTLGKNQNFSFSPTFKAANIVLQKDNKIAKLKDNNGNKIVFTHNVYSGKCRQLGIKIVALNGGISVGVGLKDKLKGKIFKFQKSAIGHGTYMISSNGYKFNHTDAKQNMIMQNSLSFVVGDQIIITCDQKNKKLLFKKKSDNLKQAEINMKGLPQVQWKDLQFCVAFSAMGDKVKFSE